MLHLLLLLAPLTAVLATAAAVAIGLGRIAGPPPTTDRLVSLDGLRGYLALGVFVHHAMMWRDYLRRGLWGYDDQSHPFYRHLGEDSVSLFFMMTGFLFAAKLAEGRARPIDSSRLYLSRVLRIYPLYGLALATVLLMIAALTASELQVEPATLARSVFAWARFGNPDINGVEATWMLTAGVQWSLAYEWLFYSALPLAALPFGVVPPARWLIASALGGRAGGAGGAPWRPRRRRGRGYGLHALRAWLSVPVLVLLTGALIVVASGNTLFGVLRWPASRLLGEIGYSIYLLHGLLLFGVLRGVLGSAAAAALPTAAYWGLIVALTVVLVVVGFATFRFVERPGIGAMADAQRWLAARRAGRGAVHRELGPPQPDRG